MKLEDEYIKLMKRLLWLAFLLPMYANAQNESATLWRDKTAPNAWTMLKGSIRDSIYTRAQTRAFVAASTPSISATSPIQYSGGVISILNASTSQTGALTSTDWNTFNNKLSSSTGWTTNTTQTGLTGDKTTSGNITANSLSANASSSTVAIYGQSASGNAGQFLSASGTAGQFHVTTGTQAALAVRHYSTGDLIAGTGEAGTRVFTVANNGNVSALGLYLASLASVNGLVKTSSGIFENAIAGTDYLTPTEAASTYVPYTGATGAVNLGAYDLTVNGITAGMGGSSVSTNTAFGNLALGANTTAIQNTAIGFEAMKSVTTVGTNNVAVGSYTMRFATGNTNTAVGDQALIGGSGNGNTAIGQGSGSQLTTGSNNTFVGKGSGVGLNTGSNNTIIGNTAMSSMTSASGNTIIGRSNYAFTASLTDNIILMNGSGSGASAIKAQHDGTNWTFTGGATITGSLTGTTATFSGLLTPNLGIHIPYTESGSIASVFYNSLVRYGHPSGYYSGIEGGNEYNSTLGTNLRMYVHSAAGTRINAYTIDASGNNTWTGTLTAPSGTFTNGVKSFSGTASTTSGVASTIYLVLESGRYEIFAYINNSSVGSYTASATVLSEGTGTRIIADNGANLFISISGMYITVMQNSGSTSPVNWSILKVI